MPGGGSCRLVSRRPASDGHLAEEDGPVRVLIEYTIPERNSPAFGRLLRAREQHRRRDGAIEWDLHRDVSKPTRRLEAFVVDSWGEHERQHATALRVTFE